MRRTILLMTLCSALGCAALEEASAQRWRRQVRHGWFIEPQGRYSILKDDEVFFAAARVGVEDAGNWVVGGTVCFLLMPAETVFADGSSVEVRHLFYLGPTLEFKDEFHGRVKYYLAFTPVGGVTRWTSTNGGAPESTMRFVYGAEQEVGILVRGFRRAQLRISVGAFIARIDGVDAPLYSLPLVSAGIRWTL